MADRPFGKRIKYGALYWLVRSLIFIANVFPRRWWLKFCGFLGKIAYNVVRDARDKTIVNLGFAYSGEKSSREVLKMSKEVFKMLGRNGGEILRAIKIRNLDDLNRILVTHGIENYEVARDKGKGVIFLTCHLGAFDLQITNMALRGLKPNIIGTPLKDERLNELLFNYRNAYGAVAIERGKETLRLIKALKTGGSVAILIDQDTKVKSRFVNFFGTPAATPVGAAILAIKTGAAIIPTYVYLDETDWKQHMHILPEMPTVITGDDEKDMVENTRIYTRFIEDTIRKYPTQWVWMHERWKTRPGEEVV
ncbi:MAG TPA: lysophospholipid acyltransferase family protein [Cyclobacteriaceae bacterium]|nr:lysophospholipid acyltransferase family protein [Cyclobacteriaceae bacterium]